jgi:valyl-tRNA synthetase
LITGSRLRGPMSVADLEHRTRYDPAEVEARIRTRWLDSGLFHPEPAGTAEENYSIAIPLPNVTGALHMGHALNGSVQDTLIRLARMRGKRTKWIFGTDHAGIATQTQVERLLRSEGTSRPNSRVISAASTPSRSGNRR